MVFIILNMPPLWLKIFLFFYKYYTNLLKIKICLITLPLKFLLFLWNNDVLSFKENDITSLIVEGGWASDDNNSSFSERPHANSDHWLITKRRVVAVARRVVAVARRVVAAARRVVVVTRRVVVVARPMTSCCRRLPTHPP